MSSTENNRQDLYWLHWVKLEKTLHDDHLLFAWLKNTMTTEEINSLKSVVSRYFSDLVVIINRDTSGKVVRKS